MNAKPRRTKVLAVCAGMLVFTACLGMMPNDQESDPRDSTGLDYNVDPHQVLGSEACEKCHASEVRVWKMTPHYDTYLTLHRKAEAQQIASRLGISSFKQDSACTKCHYTMQSAHGGIEAISGISCESCHGAAQNWIEIHNDYGGPGVQREAESAEHRYQRLSRSIAGGMRNPINVYLVAQSCYRCHTVPDERLVNQGGHKAGSMDFEIVSWSQGTVRHNFVRSDGKSIDPSTKERLRQLFVAGMIADLEFSLRATAEATQKAEFGILFLCELFPDIDVGRKLVLEGDEVLPSGHLHIAGGCRQGVGGGGHDCHVFRRGVY